MLVSRVWVAGLVLTLSHTSHHTQVPPTPPSTHTLGPPTVLIESGRSRVGSSEAGSDGSRGSGRDSGWSQGSGRDSRRASSSTNVWHGCQDTSGLLARTLCRDINRNIDSQDLHHQESPRHLQGLTKDLSYVNQGNVVHILRQQQLPTAAWHSTNSQYGQWTNQEPSAPTHNPHLPMDPTAARINSKLMSNAALALLGSHVATIAQNAQKNRTSQRLKDSQYRPVTRRKPGAQTRSPASHKKDEEDSTAASDSWPASAVGPMAKMASPSTVNKPSLTSATPLPSQKRAADMADILTNLQILTILLNQDSAPLLQSTARPHNTLTTTMTQGGNSVDLVSEVTVADPTTRPVPLLHQMEAEDSQAPPTVRPIHQAPIYHIHARNNNPQLKNYYEYAAQFPFAINASENPSAPSGGVSTPGIDRGQPERIQASTGHSYFLPHPPAAPSEASSVFNTGPSKDGAISYPPNPSVPSSSINNAVNSQAVTQAADEDGRLIYHDPASIVAMDEGNNIDRDKLVHQFAHQVSPHHRPAMTSVAPQHSSPPPFNHINALSQYLENLKNKYDEHTPPTTSSALQNHPINSISNEDLILASLLHSHLSSTEQPGIVSADTPYIPAIHGDRFTQFDEPQPPAPPPSTASTDSTQSSSSSQSTSAQSDSSSSSSSSSSSDSGSSGGGGVQNCVKNTACALFLSWLVAFGTTTAFTIPIVAPFLGKRRRRDLRHYTKLLGPNASFVKKPPLADLPDDLTDIYSSLINPKTSTTVANKISKYITQNREELLKIAVQETEGLFHKPVTEAFQDELTHANTNRLLTLLNETLIMEGDEQEILGPNEHGEQPVTVTTDGQQQMQFGGRQDQIRVDNARYTLKPVTEASIPDTTTTTTNRNTTNSNEPNPTATADYIKPPHTYSNDVQKYFASETRLNEDNSVQWKQSSEMPSGNDRDIFWRDILNRSVPDRVHGYHEPHGTTDQATRTSDLNQEMSVPEIWKEHKDIISNPQSSNTYQQLSQAKQEAPPSSAQEAMEATLLSRLYRAVCRSLTKPAVPQTDLINFMAQRCLLWAYMKLLT